MGQNQDRSPSLLLPAWGLYTSHSKSKAKLNRDLPLKTREEEVTFAESQVFPAMLQDRYSLTFSQKETERLCHLSKALS